MWSLCGGFRGVRATMDPTHFSISLIFMPFPGKVWPRNRLATSVSKILDPPLLASFSRARINGLQMSIRTRMHFSRMCIARLLPYLDGLCPGGFSLTETFWTETPPDRDKLDRDQLDRDPGHVTCGACWEANLPL